MENDAEILEHLGIDLSIPSEQSSTDASGETERQPEPGVEETVEEPEAATETPGQSEPDPGAGEDA